LSTGNTIITTRLDEVLVRLKDDPRGRRRRNCGSPRGDPMPATSFHPKMNIHLEGEGG